MHFESAWLAWALAGLAVLFGLATLLFTDRRRSLRTSLPASASEREQLMASLLDASPIAFVLCDDAGQIVFENEAARSMFFEGKPAHGLNFLRLVANGPVQFRSALLSDRDEMVGLTVDGLREIYHFSRRMFELDGRSHTLLVVRPMTREIARHDLDTLRNVVRVISHEVNNSLAPVSSLVHSARTIVTSGSKLERLERVFDTIDERAKHLSKFIGGYANLSRLPAPAPRVLEWASLMERLSALYPRAKLTVPERAQGYFDPGQMEQALINVLKNAHEAGGADQDIELTVTPLPESGTELQILDRGAGFSGEALEGALLPFFTTKAGGNGIGLALVREIVLAHQGRITLGAREGGGAAVTILLPGLKTEDDNARARLTLTRS